MRRQQRPLRMNDVLLTGINRRFYSKNGTVAYRLTPFVFGAQYNTVEGFVPDLVHSIHVFPRKGKINYYFDLSTRYGFSNHHFNSFLRLGIKRKQHFLQPYFEVSGGKRVSQFNRDNPIQPLINTTYRCPG